MKTPISRRSRLILTVFAFVAFVAIPIILITQPTVVAQACLDAPAPTQRLSVSEFSQMWTTTSSDLTPDTLIRALDIKFEAVHGAIGTGCTGIGYWRIPKNAVLWTNLFYRPALNIHGGPANLIQIKTQGNWGVFYTTEDTYISTPGRYAVLDRGLRSDDLK